MNDMFCSSLEIGEVLNKTTVLPVYFGCRRCLINGRSVGYGAAGLYAAIVPGAFEQVCWRKERPEALLPRHLRHYSVVQ